MEIIIEILYVELVIIIEKLKVEKKRSILLEGSCVFLVVVLKEDKRKLLVIKELGKV